MNQPKYKAGFPYLVDLSFSNECGLANPSACNLASVCYASPTNKITGPIDLQFVEEVILTLAKSNVLELVLGGESEPTVHTFAYPDRPSEIYELSHVIKFASDYGLRVGLTTRNYNWYKKPDSNECIRHLNSLAISCNTMKDLEAADELVEKLEDNRNTYHQTNGWSESNLNFYTGIYIQDVLELKTLNELKQFAKKVIEINSKAGRHFSAITFLGFKEFGFGKGISPSLSKTDTDWIECLKEISKKGEMSFGIDSILVNKYRGELIKAGIPEHYLVGEEGSASCYVDCMRKIVKPSSFTDDNVHQWDKDKFLEIFSTF